LEREDQKKKGRRKDGDPEKGSIKERGLLDKKRNRRDDRKRKHCGWEERSLGGGKDR